MLIDFLFEFRNIANSQSFRINYYLQVGEISWLDKFAITND